MADTNGDAKVTYPYLSSNQWYAVRNKMRQSPPKAIDIDWLISKLDTTQKTAQNLLPRDCCNASLMTDTTRNDSDSYERALDSFL